MCEYLNLDDLFWRLATVLLCYYDNMKEDDLYSGLIQRPYIPGRCCKEDDCVCWHKDDQADRYTLAPEDSVDGGHTLLHTVTWWRWWLWGSVWTVIEHFLYF